MRSTSMLTVHRGRRLEPIRQRATWLDC